MLLLAAVLLTLIQCGNPECSLDHFPQELLFTDRIDGIVEIGEYVGSVFPLMSEDLTPPLESGEFSTIDFSKRFVKNSPFPNHIVPIIDANIVKFQVIDLRKENVMIESGNFSLKGAEKCEFILAPSYPFNLSSIFLHCNNQTHFRDGIIRRFLDPKSLVTEIISYQIYGYLQPQVYYQIKYGFYPTLGQIILLYRSSSDCIIDFYTDSSNFGIKFQRNCGEMGKEIKEQFAIADFRIHSNISKLFVLQTGKLVVSLKNTFFNVWQIKKQRFLKSVSLCQTSIVAVISQSFLYFVSIDLTPGSQISILFEELARVRIDLTPINEIEANSVGKYVIISNGKQWKVFSLQDGEVKMKIFDCQIKVSQIYVDDMLCGTDTFYHRSKKYTLGAMKIIRKNQPQQKVKLTAEDCTRTIVLKTLNSSEITQVNSKNSLLCRDGALKIEQKMCIGDNLTQRLMISGQQYPIKKKQVNLLPFSEQALEYMKIDQGIVVLAKKSTTLKIYVCIDDQVLVKEITVTGNIKSLKMIKKQHKNYFSQTNLAIFLTLDNNGQNLVQLCVFQLFKMPGFNKYQLNFWKNEWNYDFFGLQSIQLMSFQIITIISHSWFGYEEADPNVKLNVIGLTKVKQNQQKTKFIHIKAFYKERYSTGIQFVTLNDEVSVNADNLCKIEQNLVILYKIQSKIIQLTLIRDISDYYQILNSNQIIYSNTFNVVCGEKSLAILHDNIIQIIDKHLKIVSTYHLSQPTSEDLIISDYIIHKASANIVQIYCIKTGFLIQQMRGLDIKQVVPSGSGNGILLKNGTYYFMEEYQTITVLQPSQTFVSLICSNTLNRIFKLKSLQSKNTLSLSTNPIITVPTSITRLNFMNSTIQKLQIFINSQYQVISHIKQGQSESFAMGKYSMTLINGSNIFSGCRNNNYNYINCFAGIYDGDQRLLTQWLVSLSEGANNKILQVFANRTMLEIISFTISEDKMGLTNSSTFCKLETSLIGEDYMYNPASKHSLIDQRYLFLIRSQMQTWSSRSQFFLTDSTIFPKAIRNANNKINKIEVYGLDGECKIDEIIPQIFAINKAISDFALIKRKGTTFVIAILVNQILIFQYPFSKSAKQFYRAQLTQQYIGITAAKDKFVILSEKNDHKMYSINWQTFPSAGTIQLQKSFVKTSEQPIIDGTMSDEMLLAYSNINVFIFYLDSNNRQVYSSETKHISEFELDDYKCTHQTSIDYIKYQQKSMFTMGVIGEYCQDYLQFQVRPIIDLQKASKIRMSNRKYSKEYEIIYGNSLQEE